MTKVKTLDEKVDQIMVDLASLKTDVSWLKKLFVGMFAPILITLEIVIEGGLI